MTSRVSGDNQSSTYQCVPCGIFFSLPEEFYAHHASHVRAPQVALRRINSTVISEIKDKGFFRLKKGVAKKSTTVSPIKISFKKQGNKKVPFITQNHSVDGVRSPNNGENTAVAKMLERGVSIQRKGKNVTELVKQETEEAAAAAQKPDEDSQKKLLEKYQGLISIKKKGKEEAGSSSPGREDEKPAGLFIGSRSAKPFDLAEYTKIMKEKENDADSKPVPKDPKSLLASLSGISFASKGGVKAETTPEEAGTPPPKPAETGSKSESSEGEESGDDSDDSTEEKDINKTDEKVEAKGSVRVSSNLFAVKKEEPEKPAEEKEMSGVDIMEAMVKKLRSTPTPPQQTVDVKPVILQPAPTTVYDDDDDDIIMEAEVTKTTLTVPSSMKNNIPPSPTPSEQLHPDFIAPQGPAPAMDGQVYQPATSQPHYSQASMGQPNNAAYSSVNSMVGTVGGVETQYWGQVNAPQPLAGTQQDPLLAVDGNVSQTFVQSYLGEQTQIPADSGEYMALERLGGLTSTDPNQQYQQLSGNVQPSTMDQLNQQVQRLQPTSPHINVVPQHQMIPNMHQPNKDGTGTMEVAQNIGPVEPVYDLMHGGMQMPPPGQQPQQQQSAGQMGQQMPQMPNMFPSYFNQNFPTMQPATSQASQPGAPPAQFQVPQPPGPLRPPALQSRPQISPRSFQSMAAPRPRTGVKRPRMQAPRMGTPPKITRMAGPMTRPGAPGNIRLPVTPPKKPGEANKVANALASRGITMTSSRPQGSPQRSPGRVALPNLGPGVSITAGGRRSLVNHGVQRPEPCATVDLTDDDEPNNRGVHHCNICRKAFASALALDSHKQGVHKNAPLPNKCEKCSAAFPTLTQLNQHRLQFHKLPARVEELAIPIVDINNAETRAKLQRLGVVHYVPLSTLESGNNGFFGLPILNINSNHDKVTSPSALGAGNVFILGKPRAM